MRPSAKDNAKALWLATRDMSDADGAVTVANFADAMRKKGLASTLADVLATLPNAIDEADTDRHVTIASARELDDATVSAVLGAIDAPKNAQVVRTVDSSLIAGVRVRTIDRTIDATAKRSLEEFRKNLSRT